MLTFDEAGLMLDEAMAKIPQELYHELNGGVVLLPNEKIHPQSIPDFGNLYIVGEYHNDRKGRGGLGRYITIYFGSFVRLYDSYPPERQREEMRKVLVHELTHHLESLAGERGLEVQDAIDLEKYKRRLR